MSVRTKTLTDVGSWKLDRDSPDEKSWSLSGSPLQYVIVRETELFEGKEEWTSIFYDHSAENADEGDLCTQGSLSDELDFAIASMEDTEREYLRGLAPWTVTHDLGELVEWELPGKKFRVVMWKCEKKGHHGRQKGIPVWRRCWELLSYNLLEDEPELVQSGPLPEMWRAAVDLRKRIEAEVQSPEEKSAAAKLATRMATPWKRDGSLRYLAKKANKGSISEAYRRGDWHWCATGEEPPAGVEGVCNVVFEFPLGTAYPCLPVVEDGLMVFPLRGLSYCTVAEVRAAQAMGATVEWYRCAWYRPEAEEAGEV